ncbi:hypothetical protein RvY_09190-2 [Ramazzottius varieornatus]|nr:hypothetical protein RvY_09190-2 [Ramazzottius varieornatus]
MESAWCGPAQHDERMFNLIVASTSVFFVIPMFLLGFAYWRIGRTLKKSERRYRLEDMRMGSSTSEHSRGGMQSRRSIIRMLSWVCIAFFVCWAPFHFQRALWAIFTKAPHWFHSHQGFFLWNSYLYPIAGCCYYFNSVINVIIYNVMSRRFREAFMDTIMTCGRKREMGYGASIHMYSTQRTGGLPAYRRQSTAPSSRRPSHFPQPIIDLVHIELHLAKDSVPEEATEVHVSLDRELAATLTPFAQADPFLGSRSSLTDIPMQK